MFMLEFSIESTHDRVAASRAYDSCFAEDMGREVEHMDTYEVLTLLILFGSFLIALLTYTDRNNKRK